MVRCSDEFHARIKALSIEEFGRFVKRLRPWLDAELVIGECPLCESTLSQKAPQELLERLQHELDEESGT